MSIVNGGVTCQPPPRCKRFANYSNNVRESRRNLRGKVQWKCWPLVFHENEVISVGLRANMASGDGVDTIEVAETSFMGLTTNKDLGITNEVDAHKEGESPHLQITESGLGQCVCQ